MWIYPGTDLHLVRTLPAPTFRVVVADNSIRNAPWQDASTIDGMEVEFTQSEQTPASVDHVIPTLVGSPLDPLNPLGPGAPQAVMLAPSATSGTSMFIATATTPDNRASDQVDWLDRGVLRVTTHDDVTALFVADNGIHIFAAESNRVLAIFAQFSDGNIAEVTGHAWLSAISGNTGVATVDAECRISAIAAGSTTITVSLADGRFPVSVAITVLPSLATGFGAAAISEQLLPKTPRHNTTLWVLSEGFTDHVRFYFSAWTLIDEWSKTSPYKELRDSFAAIGIFVAAPQRGITVGPGLAPAPPGFPATERIPWEWGLGPLPQTFLRSRDTLIGMAFGTRWNPSRAARVLQAPSTLVESFFRDRMPARTPGVDERRLPRFGVDLPQGSASPTSFEPVPPEVAFSSFLRRYIEAAGFTVGPRDRVFILVDDDLYGGLNIDVMDRELDGLPTVTVSVGRNPLVNGVTAGGPLLDRPIPVPSLTFDVQQRVAATLAHELGHSYQLGDEYQEPLQGNAIGFAPASFEVFDNVQHVKTLRRAGAPPGPIRASLPNYPTPLDVQRIKWNVPHRIVKASQALSIVGDESIFRLQLERYDARKWSVGEYAYVRTHALPWLSSTPSTAPRYNMFSTQIAAVDNAADTVDIVVPIGTAIIDYQPTPVLYVPKTGNLGVPLTAIDPAVVNYLATNGPFVNPRAATLATPCTDDNSDHHMNDDQQPAPSITNFNYPGVRALTIGLYEGAAHYACNVFRPTGRCKMLRTNDEDGDGNYSAVEFCFVCKYILVDHIDPSKHPEIDKKYPGGDQ